MATQVETNDIGRYSPSTNQQIDTQQCQRQNFGTLHAAPSQWP
jgi:hypothetical protein